MINRMGFTGRAALLSSAGLFALGMAAPAFADTAQPQPKPKGVVLAIVGSRFEIERVGVGEAHDGWREIYSMEILGLK